MVYTSRSGAAAGIDSSHLFDDRNRVFFCHGIMKGPGAQEETIRYVGPVQKDLPPTRTPFIAVLCKTRSASKPSRRSSCPPYSPRLPVLPPSTPQTLPVT